MLKPKYSRRTRSILWLWMPWLFLPTSSHSIDFIGPSLIARFMGPTWGPSGADRTQVGPMLAPWTLPSGLFFMRKGFNYLHHFSVEKWYKMPLYFHVDWNKFSTNKVMLGPHSLLSFHLLVRMEIIYAEAQLMVIRHWGYKMNFHILCIFQNF